MVDLAAFLDRRDPEKFKDNAERFDERAGSWLDVMTAAVDLHPITSACMGFHLCVRRQIIWDRRAVFRLEALAHP